MDLEALRKGSPPKQSGPGIQQVSNERTMRSKLGVIALGGQKGGKSGVLSSFYWNVAFRGVSSLPLSVSFFLYIKYIGHGINWCCLEISTYITIIQKPGQPGTGLARGTSACPSLSISHR